MVGTAVVGGLGSRGPIPLGDIGLENDELEQVSYWLKASDPDEDEDDRLRGNSSD